MENCYQQKNILRSFIRSCFCFCLSVSFLVNSFLPVFAVSSNKYLKRDLTGTELSDVAYAYKNITNYDIPSNQEIANLASELGLSKKDINIENAKDYFENKIKGNIDFKSTLIQNAYKQKHNEELSKGAALALTNTLLANNNSYPSIYKEIDLVQPSASTLLAQASPEPNVPKQSSCSIIGLDIIDFYMASPQVKIKLDNPFSSVALSSIGDKQTKLTELDHSSQNQKLAWNIFGYPTSFGLTYNSDGKFINVTTSSSPIQNLIGIASDTVKVNNAIVLGGFLPQTKFNTQSDEYYTVGVDPRGNGNKPYLYGFDIGENQGISSRAKETFNNHYTGFSQGLDVTANGLLLLGVEDGKLTGAWKSQSKSPLSIKKISELTNFTRNYINYFEVDDSNGSDEAFAIAGYLLPDTFKYTNILSALKNNIPDSNQYGLTVFTVSQKQENQSDIKILSKADFWGSDIEQLLGFKNVNIAGYKITNNTLYVSYFVNNGVDFKKFYDENYPKYVQGGKSWIDFNTGLPPSVFSYTEKLYDSRLAVFKLNLNNQAIELQKVTDISTVFDSPVCSGQSYGVSGPIEVSQGKIFIADKTYANIIRAFKYDNDSKYKIVPASIPYVVKLANAKIEKVISDSKYKPLGTDFAFATSISDIAIDPNSKILFVSLPYLESGVNNANDVHVNGFLTSVYLSSTIEDCFKVTSSQDCENGLTSEEDKEHTTNPEEVAKKAGDATFKYLSVLDGPVTPSVAFTIKTGFNQIIPPTFDKDFHVVDLDVTSSAESPEDIKVGIGTRSATFVSALTLKPIDPYFPWLKKEEILLQNDSLGKPGKSICVASKTRKISVLSASQKLLAGSSTNTSFIPVNLGDLNKYSTLISSVPGSNESFALLNTPYGTMQNESDSLVYYLSRSNIASVKNIHGDLSAQSYNIDNSETPGIIKLMTNEFQVSDAVNPEDSKEQVALSLFSTNLKSKAIKNYFDNVALENPAFDKTSGDNKSNFLKTFQGFSIFTIPNDDGINNKSISNVRTFKNFYFNNLPSQLQSSDDAQRFIAGATLFRNPKTMDLYLAVSTFDTDVTQNVTVQPAPVGKASSAESFGGATSGGGKLTGGSNAVTVVGSSGKIISVKSGSSKSGSQGGSTGQGGSSEAGGGGASGPVVTVDGLLLTLDAGNIDGNGKTPQDLNTSGGMASSWTNLAVPSNSDYAGKFNNQITWVGEGTTTNPFALQINGDGNVELIDKTLEKISSAKSYSIELVFLVDVLDKDLVTLFARGTEQKISINKTGNLVVSTYGNENTNTGVSVPIKEWSHIALTKSASDNVAALYLNGRLVWSQKTSGVSTKSSASFIGAETRGNKNSFKGKIALARAYNVALSSNDVFDNFAIELLRYKEPQAAKSITGYSGDSESGGAQGESGVTKGANDINCGLSIKTDYGENVALLGIGSIGNYDVTLSAYVKPVTEVTLSAQSVYNPLAMTNSWSNIISNRTDPTKDHSIFIGTYNQNAVIVHEGPNTYIGAKGVTNVLDGKFHQIAGERRGSEYRIYVDGKTEGVNNFVLNGALDKIPFNFTTTAPFLVGKNSSTESKGSSVGSHIISSLKIFNKALSDNEVQDEYKNLVTVPDLLKGNIVAFWKFNEATKNPIYALAGTEDNKLIENKDLRATYYGADLSCKSDISASTTATNSSTETTKNYPPVIADILLNEYYFVNQSINFAVSASDPNKDDKVTVKADGLPDWADFFFDEDIGKGTFSGIPTEAGIVEIVLIAKDKKGLQSSPLKISLDIRAPGADGGPNKPPVIKNPGDLVIKDNKIFSFNIPFSDPNGDPVTISLFSEVKVKASEVSGDPSKRGPLFLGLEQEAFTSNVQGASPFSFEQLYTIDLSQDSSDGVIVITPTDVGEFFKKPVNEFTFKVTADDGKENGKAEPVLFMVGVVNANRVPIVTPVDDQQVTVGLPFSFTIPASDPDGDSVKYEITDIVASGKTQVVAGAATMTSILPTGFYFDKSNGSLYGLRNSVKDSNGNYIYDFTVVASDGHLNGASQPIQFTVFISDGNRVPKIINPGDKACNDNAECEFQITAVDPDPEDTQLTYTIVGLPSGLNIDKNTGEVTGTLNNITDKTSVTDNSVFPPKTVYMLVNVFPITVSASDGHELGESKKAKFNISVTSSNHVPTLESPGDQKIRLYKGFEILLKGQDEDNESLKYHIKGLPGIGFTAYDSSINGQDLMTGVNFNSNKGLIYGNPTNDAKGSYKVYSYVSDGHKVNSDSGEINFNLEIVDQNTKPTIVNPGTVTAYAGETLDLMLEASDEDMDTLTYYVKGIPGYLNSYDGDMSFFGGFSYSNIFFDMSTGTISGTPASAATYTVTAYVSDGYGNPPSKSNEVTFTLKIEGYRQDYYSSTGGFLKLYPDSDKVAKRDYKLLEGIEVTSYKPDMKAALYLDGIPIINNVNSKEFRKVKPANNKWGIDGAWFKELTEQVILVQAAMCGNAIVEAPEVCDDGNTVDGDCCSMDCFMITCTSSSGGMSSSSSSGTPTPGCVSTPSVCNACQNCNSVYDGTNPSGCVAQTTPTAGCCTFNPAYAGCAVCGNSMVEGTEACDDGNTVNGDTCSADCSMVTTPTPGCVTTPSLCTACQNCNSVYDGTNPMGCVAQTTPTAGCCTFNPAYAGCAVCGNSMVEGTEACDDGNIANGDYCSADCTMVTTPTPGCVTTPSVCTACQNCNSVYDGTNPSGCVAQTTPTTGCCTFNPAYAGCAVCGNGMIEGTEACDDGNIVNGDTCSSDCTMVTTPTPGCVTTPSLCTACQNCNSVYDGTNPMGCVAQTTPTTGCCTFNPAYAGCAVCGNGMIEGTEICDDGNMIDGDTCSADCTMTTAPPMCGNWIVETGEVCDDGNIVAWDYCSADCMTVTTPPMCGDAMVEGTEVCDDGNTADGDYCSANCLMLTSLPVCGNTFVETGEACDDGNMIDGDSCSADCMSSTTLPVGPPPAPVLCPYVLCGTNCCVNGCMDGMTCDTQTTTTTTTTTTVPTGAICGNGSIETGEICDDGNMIDGDFCSADCMSTPTTTSMTTSICGNGIVEAGEVCDDGNTYSGDACDRYCLSGMTTTTTTMTTSSSSGAMSSVSSSGTSQNVSSSSGTSQISVSSSSGTQTSVSSSSGVQVRSSSGTGSSSGGEQVESEAVSSGGNAPPEISSELTGRLILSLAAWNVDGNGNGPSLKFPTWTDLSNNGNNGTLTNFGIEGSPTKSISSGSPDVSGGEWIGGSKKNPAALKFDAVDDTVTFDDSASKINLDSSFTINAWVRFSGRKSSFDILKAPLKNFSSVYAYSLNVSSISPNFGPGGAFGANPGFISADMTGPAAYPAFTFTITDPAVAGTNTYSVNTGKQIQAEKWYYVSCVYSKTADKSSTISIYLNGELKDSKKANFALDSKLFNNPVLGHIPVKDDDKKVTGRILLSSLQVYNSELTAAEIKKEYINGIGYFHPNKPTLILDCQNVTNVSPAEPANKKLTTSAWSDLNGYSGNNGELFSFSLPAKPESGWDGDNSQAKPSVLKFDGINDYVKLGNTAFEHFPKTTSIDTPFYNTVSIWFKTRQYGVLLSEQSNDREPPDVPKNYAPLIYLDKNGKIKCGFDSSFSNNASASALFTAIGGLFAGGLAPGGAIPGAFAPGAFGGGFPGGPGGGMPGLLSSLLTSKKAYNDNVWHNVAVVYKDGLESLYVDGELLDEAQTQFKGIAEKYNFYLGTGYSNGYTDSNNKWFYFKGHIANLKVYDYSLTEKQVKVNYNFESVYFPDEEVTETKASSSGDAAPVVVCDFPSGEEYNYKELDDKGNQTGKVRNNCKECLDKVSTQSSCYKCTYCEGENDCGMKSCASCCVAADISEEERLIVYLDAAMLAPEEYSTTSNIGGVYDSDVYKNFAQNFNNTNNFGIMSFRKLAGRRTVNIRALMEEPTPTGSQYDSGSNYGSDSNSGNGSNSNSNSDLNPNDSYNGYNSDSGSNSGSAYETPQPEQVTIGDPSNNQSSFIKDEGTPHPGASEKTTDWYNLGHYDDFVSTDSYENGQVFMLINFDFNSNSNWVGGGIASNPYALQFDGVDDYIELLPLSTKGVKDTNAFTVEAVVNLGSSRIGKDTIYYRGLSTGGMTSTHSLGVDGKSNILVNDKNTSYQIQPNVWYHITYTKDEFNTAAVYVNGSEVWNGKADSVGASTTQGYGYIGGRVLTNPFFTTLIDNFRGKLALFKLYKVALKSNEVEKNYADLESAILEANQNVSTDPQSKSAIESTQACGVNLSNSALNSNNPYSADVLCSGAHFADAFATANINMGTIDYGTPACKSGTPVCLHHFLDGTDLKPSCDQGSFMDNGSLPTGLEFSAYTGLPSCCGTIVEKNTDTMQGAPPIKVRKGCVNNALFCQAPPPEITVSATVKLLNESDTLLGQGAVIVTDKSKEENYNKAFDVGVANPLAGLSIQAIGAPIGSPFSNQLSASSSGSVIIRDYGVYFNLLTLNEKATFIAEQNPAFKGAQGTTKLADGKYHTIVGVRQGNSYKVYVDGKLEGTDNYKDSIGNFKSKVDDEGETVNYPTTVSDFNYLSIGNKPKWDNHKASISINQVKFYNKALSEEEIVQETLSPTEVPENLIPNVSAFWKFFEAKDKKGVTGEKYYNEVINQWTDTNLKVYNLNSDSDCDLLPRVRSTDLVLSLSANNIDGADKTAIAASEDMLTTWTDLSSSQSLNTCTLNNFIWDESSNWVGNGTPDEPFALSFNGVDNYLEKANPDKLYGHIGSIEFWVRVDDFMSHNQPLTYILSLLEDGTDNHFGIFTGYPNKNRFGFKLQKRNDKGENQVYTLASTKSEFETGKWYHIVYVVDRNTTRKNTTTGQAEGAPDQKLYVNGQVAEFSGPDSKFGFDEFPSGTATAGGTNTADTSPTVNLSNLDDTLFFNKVSNANLLRIGNLKLSKADPRTGNKNLFHFEGQLAKLRIYGIPLSAKEISNHYSAESDKFPTGEIGGFVNGVSIANDKVPPGIKLQPTPPKGIPFGESFNINVIDEGLSLPEGSNPTDHIQDLKCTLAGKDLEVSSANDIQDSKSGITFNATKDQKLKAEIKGGELREWSVEALVKRVNPPGGSTYETILRSGVTGVYLTPDQNNNVTLRAGKLFDDVPNCASSNACAYGKTSLALDQWYYITVTCNGAETHIYINGEEDVASDEKTFNAFKFDLGQLTIGGEDSYFIKQYIDDDAKTGIQGTAGTLPGTGVTDPDAGKPADYKEYKWHKKYGNMTFPGSIAQVRLYKRALTKDEINKNNRYRIEPSNPNGLFAWWMPIQSVGSIVNGYKWHSKQGIITDPALAAKLSGFSAADCQTFRYDKRISPYHTYGIASSCKSCLVGLKNKNADANVCDKCNECSMLCGYDTCDFCCDNVPLEDSKYTYNGRASEYLYMIKQYTYVVPELKKADKFLSLNCNVSDKSFNASDESLGNLFIIQKALAKASSSGSTKRPVASTSSSGGGVRVPSPMAAVGQNCCNCRNGLLLCKNGATLACSDKNGIRGVVGCEDETNELLCCQGPLCIGRDRADFECVKSFDDLASEEINQQGKGKKGKDNISSSSSGISLIEKLPKTAISSSGGSIGSIIFTSPAVEEVPPVVDLPSTQEVGQIEGVDEAAYVGDGFIDTKIFTAGQKGESKLFKKTACSETIGNFVVKGNDFFEDKPVDYRYSDSKISLYKVNFVPDQEGDTAIDLNLITEVENYVELREECTKPVQAAIAGSLLFNKATKELIVSDKNGVNIAQVFKVNFRDDPQDTTTPELTLNYKGKLNVASVYDGYVTDVVVTPNYGKSYYLLYAKANEANYNNDILIFPIVDDPNMTFVTSGNKKEQSLTGGKGKQDGNLGVGTMGGIVINSSGQQIKIAGGFGLGGALPQQANPFGDTQKGDTGTEASNMTEQAATNKGEQKKEEKPKEEENNTSGSFSSSGLEPSMSSSSGETAQQSSSSGGPPQECTRSDDCAKNLGLLAINNLFCIEINRHGQCIDPAIISPNSKIRKGKCLKNELGIQGRSPKEKICIPLKTQGSSDSKIPKADSKNRFFIPGDKQETPQIQSPESNNDKSPGGQTDELNKKAYFNPVPQERFFFTEEEETSLRVIPKKNEIVLEIDGSQFGPYMSFSVSEAVNVQFKKEKKDIKQFAPSSGENKGVPSIVKDRKDEGCKNFVDCQTSQGFFCLGAGGSDVSMGKCSFVCAGGRVAPGLDLNGDSLPCSVGFFGCDINDLSGREICCAAQGDCPNYTGEDKGGEELLKQIASCTSLKDCEKGEYCINVTSELKGCVHINPKIIRLGFDCLPSEIVLASTPEGLLCSTLEEKFDDKSSSSGGEQESTSSSSGGESGVSSSSGDSGISSSGGKEKESSSSSGGATSTSSGAALSSSSSGQASVSSSSGAHGSSSGGSSSGGKKSSSSSGGPPPDYMIYIALQTPEIFAANLKARQIKETALMALIIQSNTNIQQAVHVEDFHSYYSGERIQFSVSVTGPPDAKPQDLKAYVLSITAKEKSGSIRDASEAADLRPLSVDVEDIIASSDIVGFSSNAPPLNISLVRENERGSITAASGSSFKLKLPDFRYLGDSSGGVQLVRPANAVVLAQENKCKGESLCGADAIGLASCVAYRCWRFSKGSDCCKGLFQGLEDIGVSSSSSGAPEIPKPSCNKDTKYIECKGKNIIYVPYCKNRNTPGCTDDGKPVCKSKTPLTASSSGAADEPVCVTQRESAQLYCSDVSSLQSNEKFEPSACVSEYCSFIPSLEEKRGCCAGCSAIYDKLSSSSSGVTTSSSSSGQIAPEIDLQEEDGIKSCIDFNGGYCGQFKSSEVCVNEKCYKYGVGSDELQSCCLKYDKEISRINQLLKETKSDETGMVYNIVSFGGDNKKGPVKIQRTQELIAQSFELELPSDLQLGSLVIKAAIKDKKGKTKEAEIKIAIVPTDIKLDDTTIAQNPQNTQDSSQPGSGGAASQDTSVMRPPLNKPAIKPEVKPEEKSEAKSGEKSKELPKEQSKDQAVQASSTSGQPALTISGQTIINASSGGQPQGPQQPQVTQATPQEGEKLWLPQIPNISSVLENQQAGKSQDAIQVSSTNLTRSVLSGSKLLLELLPKIDTTGLDSKSLVAIWTSANNMTAKIPAVIGVLPKLVRAIVNINDNEPQGKAKIKITSLDGKVIVAESDITVIKPKEISSLKGVKFLKPQVLKPAVYRDPGDWQKIRIVLTGKNFIGKRAKVGDRKVIIPKNNTKNISILTVAEFKNPNIKINKISVAKQNTELTINLTLPKDYKGGKETLFISTPSGQTFIEVVLVGG